MDPATVLVSVAILGGVGFTFGSMIALAMNVIGRKPEPPAISR